MAIPNRGVDVGKAFKAAQAMWLPGGPTGGQTVNGLEIGGVRRLNHMLSVFEGLVCDEAVHGSSTLAVSRHVGYKAFVALELVLVL